MLSTRSRLCSLSVLAVLASAILTACSSGPTPDQIAAPTADKADISGYRLGSGDQIRLTVFSEPNLSGEFTLDGRGGLSLPLIGTLQAGGKTAPEVEKLVFDRLSPEYIKDPRISVEVMSYRPFYIVGEVKQPGSYPYVNGMAVINAVALAGGFTYRARESSFDINRTVNGNAERLHGVKTTEVMPGDVITVQERYF